jgi:hypothetical protein
MVLGARSGKILKFQPMQTSVAYMVNKVIALLKEWKQNKK